jgi:hypothetical protein
MFCLLRSLVICYSNQQHRHKPTQSINAVTVRVPPFSTTILIGIHSKVFLLLRTEEACLCLGFSNAQYHTFVAHQTMSFSLRWFGEFGDDINNSLHFFPSWKIALQFLDFHHFCIRVFPIRPRRDYYSFLHFRRILCRFTSTLNDQISVCRQIAENHKLMIMRKLYGIPLMYQITNDVIL